MAKRGRPNEQKKKQTAEGAVWTIVSKLLNNGDFGKTIREMARLTGYSVGAVAGTMFWKRYCKERTASASKRRKVSERRMRPLCEGETVEGRVIQIVKEASSRDDFSLTVRGIADIIGCSSAAVGKTEAWRCYVQARERDKEDTRGRLRGHRFK